MTGLSLLARPDLNPVRPDLNPVRPELNPVRPELVEGPCANFIDASTSSARTVLDSARTVLDSARTALDSARTVLDVVGFSLAMAKTYQRAGAVGKPVGSG